MRTPKAERIVLGVCVVVLLVMAGLTMGCAAIEDRTGAAPYFDAGVGYQIDTNSDWYVRTEREWQCSDNFQGRFAVGLDWGKTELEYFHQSWYTCGGPFGEGKPELYQDSINLTHRFGGK